MRTGLGTFFLFALTATALGGCQESVPKTPTFELDVKPLFAAHCTRCHGSGGMLNADPRALEKAPPSSFLDRYDDVADCSPDATGNVPLTCVGGARYEAENGNIKFYLHTTTAIRMPMQPAAPLSAWELELLDNWLAEKPPAR